METRDCVGHVIQGNNGSSSTGTMLNDTPAAAGIRADNQWSIHQFSTESPATEPVYDEPDPPLANWTCDGCFRYI